MILSFKSRLKKEILIFDGAMGTMLQSMGLNAGELPEILNITRKQNIVEIHKRYINAGSVAITTNTFGANELKLESSGFTVEKIIEEAVNNAREAIGGRDILIAQDIGPLGQLIEPMGNISFERAYEIFKRQVIQGVKSRVDLILIETMTDLYEAKAAVLAAKENSNLPVLCTMSFEKSGRTFMGCSAVSMVALLQGMGVDVLGINCSLGPSEIEPILDEILKTSKVPVMVQPNAGLPSVCCGKAIYSVTPEEFSEFGVKFANKGAKIIGGCCGTNEVYIKKLSQAVNGVYKAESNIEKLSLICTPRKAVIIDEIKLIGNRIDASGNESISEAVRNGDYGIITDEAEIQTDAGADMLYVNADLQEIYESEILKDVVKEIQTMSNVPLMITSANASALEKTLRIYNGKALVSYVNGDDKLLDSYLPMVKKYGASVIGVTIDKKGIPENIDDIISIAEKIVKKAMEYGIDKEDVFIDCLVYAYAEKHDAADKVSILINNIREKLDTKIVLNIPNDFNVNLITACLNAGVDIIIADPLNKEIMNIISKYKIR